MRREIPSRMMFRDPLEILLAEEARTCRGCIHQVHAVAFGGRLLGAFKSAGGRWRGQIVLNGKSKHLGCFATEEEAHEAYLAAKRQIHIGCTI